VEATDNSTEMEETINWTEGGTTTSSTEIQKQVDLETRAEA